MTTPNERDEKMQRDIKMIKDTKSWPWPNFMPVKHQEWVDEGNRSGIINSAELTRVYSYVDGFVGAPLEDFVTVEALCNKWGPV